MEQASTPLGTAEIDAQNIGLDPQRQYFWNVKPVQIATWSKRRKPELAMLAGMTLTSVVVSGAAMAVLFSPNLGQTLTYDPLIDDATLAASRRVSLGEQLLGQVARVLEIDIIETQGPEVGRHPATTPAMTIVAQAEKATPMPEADLSVGLKAMVLAAGVGLGVTGLMRLVPLIPFSALGPRRRQPLSQRLKPSDVTSQPLAPVSSQRPTGPNQALIPGALSSIAPPPLSWPERARQEASAPSSAVPGRRARTSAPPQKHRSRRKALRHRFAKTTQTERAKGKLQPGQAASPKATPANHASQTGVVRQPRSQAPSQPVSLVPLNSFSSSTLIPKPNGAPQPTALWPSGQPGKPGKQSPTAPTSQFDFLDDLDIRRQYPLGDR